MYKKPLLQLCLFLTYTVTVDTKQSQAWQISYSTMFWGEYQPMNSICENQKVNLHRSLKNDALVTIFVGTDETQYTVQRTLLTSASDWFVKALSERF